MTSALVGLARDGALLALALVLPFVLATLAASALTAIIGAATQARDAAIGFAPRLLAVVLAIGLSAPVIANRTQAFATRAFAAIGTVGRDR